MPLYLSLSLSPGHGDGSASLSLSLALSFARAMVQEVAPPHRARSLSLSLPPSLSIGTHVELTSRCVRKGSSLPQRTRFLNSSATLDTSLPIS